MEDIDIRYAVYVVMVEDTDQGYIDLADVGYEPAVLGNEMTYEEASQFLSDIWINN